MFYHGASSTVGPGSLKVNQRQLCSCFPAYFKECGLIHLSVPPPNLAIILLQRPVNKSDLRTYESNQTSEVWCKIFLCVEFKLSILASSTQWDSTVCAPSSGSATRRGFRFILLRIGQLRLLFFCSGINSNSFTKTLEALHCWRWINARTHVVALGCYITAWLWCCGFVLVHRAWVAPEGLLRDFKRYSRDQILEQILSEQSSP